VKVWCGEERVCESKQPCKHWRCDDWVPSDGQESPREQQFMSPVGCSSLTGWLRDVTVNQAESGCGYSTWLRCLACWFILVLSGSSSEVIGQGSQSWGKLLLKCWVHMLLCCIYFNSAYHSDTDICVEMTKCIVRPINCLLAPAF